MTARKGLIRDLGVVALICLSGLAHSAELQLASKDILTGTNGRLVLSGREVGSFGFVDSNPRQLFLNTKDGLIEFYDLDTGKFVAGPNLKQKGLLWCFCRWSPDGKNIAYLFHRDLYLYDISSQRTRKLSTTGTVANFAWVSPSRITYDSFGKTGERQTKFLLYELATGSQQELFRNVDDYRLEDFARGKGRLFYSYLRDRELRKSLFQADLIGEKLTKRKILYDETRIQVGDSSVSVTDDGKYAVLTGSEPRLSKSRHDAYHRDDIYMFDTSSGRFAHIKDQSERWVHNYLASIAPNASGIVFANTYLDASGIPNIVILRYAAIDHTTLDRVFK